MAETPKNTIRTFALVCVAATSAFVMAMAVWYTILLSSPDWCAQAVGAAHVGARPQTAVALCFDLFKQQLTALAVNSFIFVGIIALCLGVLMVIVVAGGRLSFKAGRDGASADIGSDRNVT